MTGLTAEMDPADQARALIDADAYMTRATADAAGVPWASPVSFAHEADDEVNAALETYSRRSREQGGRSWSPGDVEGEAALRLYRAVVAAAYLLDDHDRRIAVELG